MAIRTTHADHNVAAVAMAIISSWDDDIRNQVDDQWSIKNESSGLGMVIHNKTESADKPPTSRPAKRDYCSKESSSSLLLFLLSSIVAATAAASVAANLISVLSAVLPLVIEDIVFIIASIPMPPPFCASLHAAILGFCIKN